MPRPKKTDPGDRKMKTLRLGDPEIWIITGHGGSPVARIPAPRGSFFFDVEANIWWRNTSPNLHSITTSWAPCCPSVEPISEPTFVVPNTSIAEAEAAFTAICSTFPPGGSFYIEFTGIPIYGGAPVPSVWKAQKAVSDGECRAVEFFKVPPF